MIAGVSRDLTFHEESLEYLLVIEFIAAVITLIILKEISIYAIRILFWDWCIEKMIKTRGRYLNACFRQILKQASLEIVLSCIMD